MNFHCPGEERMHSKGTPRQQRGKASGMESAKQ